MLLCVCLIAEAQPVAPTAAVDIKAPLSLDQCVTLSLQRHPDVLSARAAAEQAAAQARIVRSQLYPRVTAEGQLQESKSIANASVPGSGGTRSTRDLDVALTYTLYESGRLETIHQSDAQATAATYGILDAQRLLVFQVRQSFYAVLAARQNLRVSMRSLANAQRHHDLVQARVDAGVAPQSDLYPVNVEVSNAQLASVQAETTLDVAYAALKVLLVVPASTTLDLVEALPQGQFNGQLASLLNLAEAQRPDLLGRQWSLRAAVLGTQSAQAQAGVTVSATASAAYGRFTDITDDQWTVSLGASYPLFDYGAARAQVTAARSAEEISRQSLKNTNLQVQQDVETAYTQLRQAAATLSAAVVSRQNAELSLTAAEARYKEGLAIIIEVTDAEISLLQAELAEVQARYNQAVAVAALTQATGREMALVPVASQ
jgi:outer membrane protein